MKDTRQWGVRAPLSSRGLTIEAINIGIYGDIPDESREMTRMPRDRSPFRVCPASTTTR